MAKIIEGNEEVEITVMVEGRYARLIENIFLARYENNASRVEFIREDIETAAKNLGIVLPKNLGDVIYSFKYRTELPESVKKSAAEGKEWVIKNVGRSKYAFDQISNPRIVPDNMLMAIKIPDATPGIVTRYALDDEQALYA